MKIDLDKFELMYLLDSCARGSHLRQHIWSRFIDEVYPKLRQSERDFIFHMAVRDLYEVMVHDAEHSPFKSQYPKCGEDDYLKFLSCFTPGNRYKITCELDGQRETADCFRHNGEFWTDSRHSAIPERIVMQEQNRQQIINRQHYLDTYNIAELKGYVTV